MIAAAVATAAALRFSVAPERLLLAAGGTGAVTVRAGGAAGARVAVAVGGYALDLRGRAVLRGTPPGWLRARPQALVLPRGGTASVQLAASPLPRASPGDHALAVLFSFADPLRRGGLVRVRVGVVVVVRVPGAVRHRLAIVRLGRDRGRLLLVVANRGNVEEVLGRGRVVLRLSRRGRVVATFRAPRRRLLAHGAALFAWRLPDRLHGRYTATVEVPRPSRARAYPLRL